MATTSRAPTRTSLQLPRPIEPIKPLASEPCGPQTANSPLLAPTLHLFARASCSNQRRPPQPNLHSPNSRPAVQCNEGFCNAPERSALDLDNKHSVAETSPLCEAEPPRLTHCGNGKLEGGPRTPKSDSAEIIERKSFAGVSSTVHQRTGVQNLFSSLSL